MLTSSIKGMDEARRAMRNIAQRAADAEPALKKVAFGLAKMWRANIDAGPNERWQAGPSRRVMATGSVTLSDRGLMKASIQGAVTSPVSCVIGSALTTRGSGKDWNQLATHEFGARVQAAPGHALPIPLTAQARRTAPRDFPGLFMVKRAGRNPFLATSLMGGRGKNRGEIGITPQYALVKSVRIPARPTAPVDWKTGNLLPAADRFVRTTAGDYVVEGKATPPVSIA
ncbi:MAG: hypothetical protein NTY01_05595 [Verrucomicrobia bacterium]|nr:hypothetical protein [Verrucomicrobiota bacterium]